MDVNKLLNYEEECFNEGFSRGREKGLEQGHTEGRELGIQTGYQRYLSMGVLQARVAHWQADERTSSDKALAALSEIVATPNLNNEFANVEEFDRKVKFAKNKSKIIALNLKSPPVNVHEQKIMFQRGASDTTAIEDL